MTEKELEKQIIEALNLKGIFCWKNQSTGIYDPTRKVFRKNKSQLNGVSDILGILPNGRFLAIEVKRPALKPRKKESLEKMATPEQLKFIDNINRRGGLAFVADNLDIVLKNLDEYLK